MSEFAEMGTFVCTACRREKLAMHFYFRKGRFSRQCRRCLQAKARNNRVGNRVPAPPGSRFNESNIGLENRAKKNFKTHLQDTKKTATVLSN